MYINIYRALYKGPYIYIYIYIGALYMVALYIQRYIGALYIGLLYKAPVYRALHPFWDHLEFMHDVKTVLGDQGTCHGLFIISIFSEDAKHD